MQLDASLLNSMYSPFPKKSITYYVYMCILYITDTMSVACVYFIALPSSYLYCVVLMLFQEIWGRGGRVGYTVGPRVVEQDWCPSLRMVYFSSRVAPCTLTHHSVWLWQRVVSASSPHSQICRCSVRNVVRMSRE